MATILIIDDRAINRQFLVTLLGYGGHRLREAADGIEALAQVRTEHPDLIISDILMPQMDGFEFVSRLCRDPVTAQIPVIFYTATYRLPEARALANACGVSAVLGKPADPQVILETVNAALGTLTPAPPPQPMPSVPVKRAPSDRLFDKLSQCLAEMQTLCEQLAPLVGLSQALTAELEMLQSKARQLAQSLPTAQSLGLRLAAVVELSLELVSERDPQRLLEQCCRAVQNIVTAKYAVLGVLDDTDDSLRYLVSSGLEPQDGARLGSLSPRHLHLPRPSDRLTHAAIWVALSSG